MAPLRIAIRWRVTLRPDDRVLDLTLADDEAEQVIIRSETTIHEPQPEGTTRTVNAHWEISSSGRYVVVGCVRPRGACVGQALVVS
jgi:hypothetical protein